VDTDPDAACSGWAKADKALRLLAPVRPHDDCSAACSWLSNIFCLLFEFSLPTTEAGGVAMLLWLGLRLAAAARANGLTKLSDRVASEFMLANVLERQLHLRA